MPRTGGGNAAEVEAALVAHAALGTGTHDGTLDNDRDPNAHGIEGADHTGAGDSVTKDVGTLAADVAQGDAPAAAQAAAELASDPAGSAAAAQAASDPVGTSATHAALAITHGAPNAIADTGDARFPTGDEKAALAGTGTPAAGDKYVNDSDARNTNERTPPDATVSLAKLDTDMTNFVGVANGLALDSPSVTVDSDGATITASIQKEGGGNIRIMFSTGVYTWTTAPATIALTQGTDEVFVRNYIYILETTKALTVSTVGWPADNIEHMRIGDVLCQTAATMATKKVMKLQAWTDHVASSPGNGHIAHDGAYIRQQHASYVSGAAPTFSGTGTATIGLSTTAGVIYQSHQHSFPLFSNPATIYCVNDPDTAYREITNIADLLKDSTGASLTGKTYAITFWGCVSEATGDCKIYCSLPAGSEGANKASKVREDKKKEIDYSIPSEFLGTGFLLYRLVIWNDADTTWTLYTGGRGDDLRGKIPNTAAGGGAVAGSEFSDAEFEIQNSADDTSLYKYNLAGMTAGAELEEVVSMTANRTRTQPDADGTYLMTDGDGSALTGISAGGGTLVHTPAYADVYSPTELSGNWVNGAAFLISEACSVIGVRLNAQVIANPHTLRVKLWNGSNSQVATQDFVIAGAIGPTTLTFTAPYSIPIASVGETWTISAYETTGAKHTAQTTTSNLITLPYHVGPIVFTVRPLKFGVGDIFPNQVAGSEVYTIGPVISVPVVY